MVQAIILKPINDELQSKNKKEFRPITSGIMENVGIVSEPPADAATAEIRTGESLQTGGT